MRCHQILMVLSCVYSLIHEGRCVYCVGLHLRINNTFLGMVQRAVDLKMDFFQCFFVMPVSNQPLVMNAQEIKDFINFRERYFTKLYVHGSYWINPSGLRYNGYHMLEYELHLAQQLAFT